MAWVGKLARRYKTNTGEYLQSQSQRQLTKKTTLNLTAHRIICKSKYQNFH